MAYLNNYGINLGVRTGVIENLERGQRPGKYFNLSDPSFNQCDQGLGRFNFDPVMFGDHCRGEGNTLQPPLLQQQQFNSVQTSQILNQIPINAIPLHKADFTKPPPGFPVNTPTRPLLIDTRAAAPNTSQMGGYAASLANSNLEYNDYEGKVWINT